MPCKKKVLPEHHLMKILLGGFNDSSVHYYFSIISTMNVGGKSRYMTPLVHIKCF